MFFLSNLKRKIFTSLNKRVISYPELLSSSNKIGILSKSSKDTNEASTCVQPEAILQHTCSLVCDVIDFIGDLKLFKSINRNYFNVANSLLTIPRPIDYAFNA